MRSELFIGHLKICPASSRSDVTGGFQSRDAETEVVADLREGPGGPWGDRWALGCGGGIRDVTHAAADSAGAECHSTAGGQRMLRGLGDRLCDRRPGAPGPFLVCPR